MLQFLLKVWGLARPYRTRLFLGILTGVVAGIMEPVMIASVTFAYGLVFPSAHSPALTERLKWAPEFLRDWAAAADQSFTAGLLQTHPGAVIFLVTLIPFIVALRGLFTYLNVYFLQWTAIRAITDLRVRLFDHLMGLSVGFFSRTNTGELISRLISDTGALNNVLSNATATMVRDPVVLISTFGYLLWQQPKITLISMVVMPACMIPIIIYNRKVRRSSRALQNHIAELGSVMVESFSGNRIVKAYNLESEVLKQFRATASKFLGHYMRIIRSSEIPGPLLETVGALGVSLVLLYLLVQGNRLPTSEDFLPVILGLFVVYRPLKNIARLYNSLEIARAASARVFELLAEQNDIPERKDPTPLKAAGASIHFENIRFAYGEKIVLDGVSLTVRPGQLVALVGASGSGKTTLTSLLLRFHDPQEGRIRIGDVNILDVATRNLRSQIAVVTQETVLFDETILRNIELGRLGASRSEIVEAARHAHAYDFIMEKPDGFDTVIGERGVLLSGGQRQRLAIARAVLKEAPILVLDEATSSLDTESERAVQAALEELMQGRTTLCIAHRLSTIQRANLIVVLESGRIVETGTHATLMERSGIYRKLYDLQFQTSSAPS